MRTVMFRVREASRPEDKKVRYKPQYVILPGRRGGEPIYVVRGLPPGTDEPPGGLRPRFTLYGDVACEKPLCIVARRTTEQSGERRLVVLTPSFEEIGFLTKPPRRKRWRPQWKVEPVGGRTLVGHSGTIPAWVLFILLSPLWLAVNVVWLLDSTGDWAFSLPSRTAWRADRPWSFSLAPLKYYGLTERYKLRAGRLDPRLGYAQSVMHWEASHPA